MKNTKCLTLTTIFSLMFVFAFSQSATSLAGLRFKQYDKADGYTIVEFGSGKKATYIMGVSCHSTVRVTGRSVPAPILSVIPLLHLPVNAPIKNYTRIPLKMNLPMTSNVKRSQAIGISILQALLLTLH
jgi:hypothetical protein